MPSSGWNRSHPRHSLSVVDTVPQHVVILYTHPLLGEGVAQLLNEQPGMRIDLVDVSDEPATEFALHDEPDVVILERNARVGAIDLLREAPGALLIDVGLDAGPTWTYQRSELPGRPDSIVDAIRRRSCKLAVTG